MVLTLDTDAARVADDLGGVVEDATRAADIEAADLALRLVSPKTPRRTGRLVAGLSSVVVTNGFDLVDPVPYATVVDARTGFATATFANAEAEFTALYDTHLQDRLDAIP